MECYLIIYIKNLFMPILISVEVLHEKEKYRRLQAVHDIIFRLLFHLSTDSAAAGQDDFRIKTACKAFY
jgi:hypothetical protein